MVFYSQSCRNPNKKNTPILNVKNIKYIATRLGTVLNSGKDFGLFGKTQSMKYPGNIKSLEDTLDYIRDKSKSGTNMYRAIVSVSEADALTAGLDDRKNWEKLLRSKMYNVAKENAIPIENLEWVGSFHMTKGHPHVHLMFWDKNQGIKSPYIPEDIFRGKMQRLRVSFSRAAFPDVFKELYKRQDEQLDTIKGSASSYFDEFDEIIANMDNAEFKKIKNLLTAVDSGLAEGKIINNRFKDKNLIEVFQRIAQLREIVPKTGRLFYGFMPPEVKDEIDKLSRDIISRIPDCKNMYGKYIQTAEDICRLTSNDSDIIQKYRDGADEKIMKDIGNQILKLIREYAKSERNLAHEEYQKELATNIVISVFRVLTNQTQTDRAKLASQGMLDNKQARREIAVKQKDASFINWEV